MDEHCRITVVGERRQVDLAVPAAAPITTYVNTLARLCDQQDSDIMPAAWSLATAMNEPFAPERSLAQLGVVDGQILYLRDVVAHEFDEPVVHDVGERVSEVAERFLERRWDVRARVVTVMAIGLCWLVAVLVVLASRGQPAGSVLADVAVTAGLVLPSLAWVGAERRWPVPSRMREALALTAVPLLALGGRVLAASAWSAGMGRSGITEAAFTTYALVVGALAGALLAYFAAPGVAAGAVLLVAVVAAVVGCVLVLLGANSVESAAVVALVAFVLLTITPLTVSRLVAFAYRRANARRPAGENDEAVVSDAVRAAMNLLVVWTCGLAAVLAALLVPLAASNSPYAAGLAGCLGLALLLRAGEGRLVAEVVPVGLAGTAALFTLLVVGSGHLGWADWIAPTCACLTAAVLLVYGYRNLMRRPELPSSSAHPRWLSSVSSLLGSVSVGLAVATFGTLDWFVDFGQRL